MGISNLGRELVLLRRMLDRKHSTVSLLPMAGQKPECRVRPILQALPRCTPESKGIPSGEISEFIKSLCRFPEMDIHSVMILRNGEVLSEFSFSGYDRLIWHATFSACKSIVSLAVGMLVDEGKLCLEDKISDLFRRQMLPLAFITLKNLTVRHLLEMSSGVTFDEAGALTEQDWVRRFLNSSVRSEPGTKFHYNSLNTYMLGVIVSMVSGETLTDYLRKRLFEPLGIEEYFWEKCPMGFEKGGWGLYIRLEDLAKIGQLVMQKGVWNGQRILSENWIHQATYGYMETPESYGEYRYGYQIWTGENKNVFLFNGIFGQNVIGFPESGVLIVSNAGYNELFLKSRFLELVMQTFVKSFPDELPENRAAWAELKRTETPPDRCFFRREKTFPAEQCAMLSAQPFRICGQNGGIGLMPMFLQAEANNYTSGIEHLRFSVEEGVFVVYVLEAKETHRLPVGFAEVQNADLRFREEPYRVAVSGKFGVNEDEVPVLTIRVSFVETPHTRWMKIYLHEGDRLEVLLWESPGKEVLTVPISSIQLNGLLPPFAERLLQKVDTDYLLYKIESVFEPKLIAEPEDVQP